MGACGRYVKRLLMFRVPGVLLRFLLRNPHLQREHKGKASYDEPGSENGNTYLDNKTTSQPLALLWIPGGEKSNNQTYLWPSNS